jgi:hypothetical protein
MPLAFKMDPIEPALDRAAVVLILPARLGYRASNQHARSGVKPHAEESTESRRRGTPIGSRNSPGLYGI